MVGLTLVRNLPQSGPALAAWRTAVANVGGPAGWPGEWLDAARVMAVVAGLALVLHEGGRRLGGWLHPVGALVEEGWVLRILLGWTVAGLALAGLAATGLYRPAPLVVAALVPAWSAVVRALRRPAGSATDPRFPRTAGSPASAWGRAARWTALGSVALLAVVSLPFTTDPDSLIQHLVIADRALLTGNLTAPPGNLLYHAWAPNELLRGWVLLCGGQGAVLLPSLMGHLLALQLLVAVVGRIAGGGWGWFAAAAWVTNSVALGATINAKPDAWLAPLGMAGAMLWLRRGAGGAAGVVGGLLLGAAVAAKPVAAPYAVMVGVLGAAQAGWRWQRLLWFGAAASVPVIPWAVKTWLVTGDPAIPLGYPWFHGLGVTDALHRIHLAYIAQVTHLIPETGAGMRVTAPWRHVMAGGVSPVFLALLPLAWTAPALRAFGWRWPAVVSLSLAAWMTGPIQFRYLLAALPAWLAAGTVGLAGAGPTGRITAGVLLASQVAVMLARPEIAGRLPAGFGFEPRARYTQRAINIRADSLAAISRLPAGSVVALVGSSYGIPAPRRLLPHNFTQPPFFYDALRSSATLALFSRRMRASRVTHVLHNPPGAIYSRLWQGIWPMTPRDLEIWSAWWKAHAREISRTGRSDPQGGFEVLYAIAERPEGPPPMGWLPGIEGVLGYFEQMFNREGREGGMARLEIARPMLGDLGPFLHLEGAVWAQRDPDRALELFRRADSTGMRDILFAEDWLALAARRGDRNAEALARRRIAELGGTASSSGLPVSAPGGSRPPADRP